jgi:hypothetical protein
LLEQDWRRLALPVTRDSSFPGLRVPALGIDGRGMLSLLCRESAKELVEGEKEEKMSIWDVEYRERIEEGK